MEGSILLNRKLLDSSVFASEKRLKIWIWILLKANYKKRFVTIKIGKGESTIEIQRGELLFGRFKAEEVLNIDGSTIYKILQYFEKEEMIVIKSNSHYTIISICNYDIYQTLEIKEVTTIEQPYNSHVTAIKQPRNTYKKDNKDKQDNKEYIYPDFLEFKTFALENQKDTDLNKLELKFKAWVAADWHNGKGAKIKNWKSTLLNTLAYLKTESKNNGSAKTEHDYADAEFWAKKGY